MWGPPYLRRLLSVNLSLVLDALSVDTCRDLYISQVAFGGLLLACIQAILMLRGIVLTTIQVSYVWFTLHHSLCSLYPRPPYRICDDSITRSWTWITAWNHLQNNPEWYWTVMYEAHQRSRHHTFRVSLFNALSAEAWLHAASHLFSVSAILPQLLVLGLTIKRFISGLRAGWGRIPIVSRLVRDDIILVSVICEFRRKRRVCRSFRSLKFVVEGLKLNWFSIPYDNF